MPSAPPAPFTPDQRYYPFSRFLRERFGKKVCRVMVDGGFTCPNVDGSVAVGGCVYCDNRSFSPNRRQPRVPIREQVRRGITSGRRRYQADRFLLYFQAATNTYAPVEKLRRMYEEALDHPEVVGLAIGTRPDSVPEPVLAMIEGYARDHYICLELGLQTIHDRSLDWMNRGHHFDAFLDAVQRCEGRGFDVCAHVILGLPGESHADMMATAETLARLPVQAIKIHNLHVVRDTPLEEQYRAGKAPMLERDEYVALVCDFLERLPANVVIHRLQGDAPPDYLVAPTWCLDRQGVHGAVRAELVRRGTTQGARFVATHAAFSPRSVRWSLPLVGAEEEKAEPRMNNDGHG